MLRNADDRIGMLTHLSSRNEGGDRTTAIPSIICRMHTTLSRSDAVFAGCTLSVVSHGQGSLVEGLLADLSRVAPRSVNALVVTRNLPNDPIRVPSDLSFAVHFIENSNPRGFGANHNAAFAKCATPWFVVLNPDLRFHDDPFTTMLAAARTDTGLIAPVVREPDGTTADSARALITPLELVRRALRRERRPARRPDWFAGMFLMLRAEAFAEIGGFDTRYFMYCEDVDLSARLALAGWRLRQAAGARVVHDARRASHSSLRHLRWHLASLARLWSSSAFWRYRSLLRGRAGAHGSNGAKPARSS